VTKAGADSARRAIDLLFAFERKPMATVRELSEHVGVPLPSAHRYVAMLKEMGLIEESRHGQYRLTMRVAALGQAARRATSVIDVAQPHMQALSDETHETILLIQPIAGLPVCTHRIEAQQRLRLSFEVGQHLPALRGASPRLLLAGFPEEDRRKYVEDALERGEQPPRSGVEEFLAEVQRDAERGWAVSSAEIDEGVWSAAATIRSEGKPIGTLSAPCPAVRINDDKAGMIIESVRRTAGEISAALGS
jgi:DNA-binding IclR family transcriptional regulator